MMKTTTIRDRPLVRRATKDDRCIVCGKPVVVYDWSTTEGVFQSIEIANPDVCHVNLGNEVASYWCPRMRS
jgi:hypothetical protein